MSDTAAAMPMQHSRAPSDIRLVIAASSAGTVFEWYDFFIYGTLAALIGKAFFPAGNETLQLLLVWAGFAVGFGFRPLGAILFGYLGDRLGRKYTFLVTVTLMGIATAGVGLIPSAATIGLAAPVIVILLRILQGLALGGEYGGAAIYVAEHAPPEQARLLHQLHPGERGRRLRAQPRSWCSRCRALIPSAETSPPGAGACRSCSSIALLAISLWMRLKLSRKPGVPGDEGSGRDRRQPVRRKLHLSRQQEAHLRRAVRRRRRC